MLPLEVHELARKCERTRAALARVAISIDEEGNLENGDALNRAETNTEMFLKAAQAQEVEMRMVKENALRSQMRLRELRSELTAEKARKESLLSTFDKVKIAKAVTEVEKDLMRQREEGRARLEEKERKLALAQQASLTGSSSSLLEELTSKIDMFTERMGMRITKSSNDFIKVEFRFIDPRDQNRAFSFKVRSRDAEFEVSEVTPSIPGLDELVRRLNNDPAEVGFSRFCRSIRKKFREPFIGY